MQEMIVGILSGILVALLFILVDLMKKKVRRVRLERMLKEIPETPSRSAYTRRRIPE